MSNEFWDRFRSRFQKTGSHRSSSKLKGSRQRSPRATQADFNLLEPRLMLTAGNGLQAQYFNAPDLSGPALVRIDPTLNFNWGTGSPDGSIGSNNFSARWSGQVESPFTETFSFIVNANDGARLWVNGQLLIDQFTAGSLTNAMATIDLIAGRRYDLQLEYREATGAASVSLEWSSNSQSRQIIPVSRLYAANVGTISVNRWNGITGNTVASLTADPDFPGNPDVVATLTTFESISNIGNNYGQQINGWLHVPTAGPYTFYVAGDQSAQLWLSNSADSAGKKLIASVDLPTAPRDWTASANQKSAVVYLAAGQDYYIEALHKEGTGVDHLAVGWQRPGRFDIEVIDGKFLSPVMPEVLIYSKQPNVAEGSGNTAKWEIVRNGAPTNLPLIVNYSIGGTAQNGIDYQSLTGSITIPAGAPSVNLELIPLSDSIFEGDESVTVELLAGPGYEVGFKSERIVYGTVQDDSPVPAGGTTLWNGQALGDMSFFGGNFSTQIDATFGNVIQVVIPATAGNPWNSQLIQTIDAPVNKGDILFVEFRIKSIGGPGEVAAIFEEAGGAFTKSLSQGIPVSTQWQKIQIPFVAAESYAVGAASFGFHLNYGAQTLQFTDFQVLNYGPQQTIAPETAFYLNNIGGNYGNAQIVSVTGQPFTFAYEVKTVTVPPVNWHLQAVEQNEGFVPNGNTMRFEFWLRSTAGASPQTRFIVQETSTGYPERFSQTINLTSNWQFFSFDVPAVNGYNTHGVQAVFIVGQKIQTTQIGGFLWTNLNSNIDFEDLPQQFPASTYDGRDGTDVWRTSADDRIADDRMSNVTINVTDINNQPLSGAVISLRQNEHQFKFGTAISAYGDKLDTNGNATALKYQSEIKRLFNTVVLENSLKWPSFLQDSQRGIDGVNWANASDLYVRGHNIIWPSRAFMPANVWTEYDTRVVNNGAASANAWLKTTIEARFDNVLQTFDGKITEWDVVNEPWSNHDAMDKLGNNIMIDWFQRVRDFDANIKLTLNDYGIFAGNGGNTGHRDNFDAWLTLLNNANLLDVIGEQSHYNDASLTDIAVLGQLINTYQTQFGQEIAITEFDVDTKDEQLQADYLRDYLTMSFSQSAVTEFLHWGFWQNSHWLPDAALYRTDFSIKPNGQAYEDLVFGRWWTDVQGTSNSGSFSTDAFLGDYDVFVEYNGQTFSGTVLVDSSGNSSVTVNVPVTPVNYDPLVSVDIGSTTGDVLKELINSGLWQEPEGETVVLTATLGQVIKYANGTWAWTFTPQQRYVNQVVTVTATDARGATAQTSFTINANTNITKRGVSYGNSFGFGETEMSNKEPLMPGQIATFVNYTSYTHGLSRVLVNVAGLASTSLTYNDFEFRVGNSNSLSDWVLLDADSAIPRPTISLASTGINGLSQIKFSWGNGVVKNTWLQVVIKNTAATGLGGADTFYFGNQIGDVDGATNPFGHATVDSFDTGLARASQAPITPVGINNPYDVDRSGFVDAFDVGDIRTNQMFSGIFLITAPLDSNIGANDLFSSGGNLEGGITGTQKVAKRGSQLPIGAAADLNARRKRNGAIGISTDTTEISKYSLVSVIRTPEPSGGTRRQLPFRERNIAPPARLTRISFAEKSEIHAARSETRGFKIVRPILDSDVFVVRKRFLESELSISGLKGLTGIGSPNVLQI